jgi:ribosomal protein S27AE
MWARFRNWKHAVVPVLIALAYAMMTLSAEGSALWYAGIVLTVGPGLAYVIEEVVWNVRGQGRPCAKCGHRALMKSFRVRNTCSKCGEQL